MGQTAFSIGIGILGLALAGLAVALYQIVRQQGRLLLRLDQVERRLGLDAREAVLRGTVAIQARQPAGLALGTTLPDFHLPDLDGREVTLASFRGRRVLLVHWNTQCGYCDRIAPDLAGLQADLGRANVELVLVSGGTAAAERESAAEHGLTAPILLADGGEVEAFAPLGTPAAYLLDEEGRVAAPLALGADQVPALARSLVSRRTRLAGERPLAASRIERDGLPAGTPAPAFELPEVRGGTVSLDAYRGRKVLLVFSDPHCGPCGELTPHLARLHEEHRGNGLDLLLVSRGGLEENREKALAQGLEFPVLVQRKWEISKLYGIFATPVGFLIDEEGMIARDVAQGVDPIVALASPAGKEVAHV
jgi:peroxiredoxin